jgi:hypothetical protein
VDSTTMDEHIQATISEGGDEAEPSDVPDVDVDANTETNLTQINAEVKLASRDELGTLIKILKSPLQSYSVLRQSARVSKRWDVPLSVLEQNTNQPQGNEALEPVEEGDQPCSELDSSGHSVAATAPIFATFYRVEPQLVFIFDNQSINLKGDVNPIFTRTMMQRIYNM